MGITEVAKRSNVSPSTVSRVLNSDSRVSEETLARVKAAMAELNYKPKPIGQRPGPKPTIKISKGRGFYALIAPEISRGFYSELHKCFERESSDLGHKVIACSTYNDTYRQADTIIRLMDEKIAGVAIVPTSLGPPAAHHINLLQNNGIPVVLLHRGVEGCRAPVIRLPSVQIGEIAGQAILNRGIKRIVYISSQKSDVAEGYERGLRKAVDASKLRHCSLDVHYGELSTVTDTDYNRIANFIESIVESILSKGQQGPIGIFTGFQAVGEMIFLNAVERKLSVPGDVSIVTVGAVTPPGFLVSKFASVDIDELKAAKLAVSLLNDMSNGKIDLYDKRELSMSVKFKHGSTLI